MKRQESGSSLTAMLGRRGLDRRTRPEMGEPMRHTDADDSQASLTVIRR